MLLLLDADEAVNRPGERLRLPGVMGVKPLLLNMLPFFFLAIVYLKGCFCR